MYKLTFFPYGGTQEADIYIGCIGDMCRFINWLMHKGYADDIRLCSIAAKLARKEQSVRSAENMAAGQYLLREYVRDCEFERDCNFE